MRLENEVIIVTGGSGGLGKAMAKAFVNEGASVIVTSRSAERASQAAADIGSGSGTALGIEANVRSWEDIQQMVADTVARFDRVDTLVNNAGVYQPTVTRSTDRMPIAELPVDIWDTILETNLRGVFLCTKAVLNEMLPRDSGTLMHISSGHSKRARPRRAAYVTSKFGLEGFCKTLALELEETGLSSFVLRPPEGGVWTEARVRKKEVFEHSTPEVIAEPAVKLIAGAGRNGERYIGGDDGSSFSRESYSP